MTEIQPFEGGDMHAHAAAYFEDVFPGSIVNLDLVPMSEEALENLRDAGLGAAEIIQPDGTHFMATYFFACTPVTEAIDAIYDFEQSGVLPFGSHEQAIDDIIAGLFHKKWGRFLPRQ